MPTSKTVPALLCLVPGLLLAQGAPLPPSPTPPPITGFTGRYQDATGGAVAKGCFTRLIKVAPELGRVFVALSDTKLAIYYLSDFPQRVTTSAPAPCGDTHSPFDAQIDPAIPGAGWLPLTQSANLYDFDWDSRGYIYLAYNAYGFAIADPQGNRVFQASRASMGGLNPWKVVTFASGGRTYVLVAAPSIAGNQARIYDVTNPSQPVLLNVPVPDDVNHAARSIRGDAIALVASGSRKLLIYTADALAAGGAPLSFTPTGLVFFDVASDGDSFFVVEKGAIERFAPSNGQYVRTTIYSNPSFAGASCYLGYGGGYLAALWFDMITPVALLLRFNGSGFDATDISAFFHTAYGGINWVSTGDVQPFSVGGNTYLGVALIGVGDVYSLAPAVRPGTVQVGTEWVTVVESAGTASVPVVRIDGSDGAISVPYTISPVTPLSKTGLTGPANGTLSLAAGQTSNSITIPIVNDSINQNPRTFTVSLGTPSGGALLGMKSSAVVTILDDDPPLAPEAMPALGTLALLALACGVAAIGVVRLR